MIFIRFIKCHSTQFTFQIFRGKLHGRFKYAKLFKDAAELAREKEEKEKAKAKEEQQQSQAEENSNGQGQGQEVANMLDEMTIGGGAKGKN